MSWIQEAQGELLPGAAWTNNGCVNVVCSTM